MSKEIINKKMLNELQNLLLVLEMLPTNKIIEELDIMYSNTNIDYLKKFQDNNNRMKVFFIDKIHEIQTGNDAAIFIAMKGLLSISRMIDGLGSGDYKVRLQVSSIEKKIYKFANEYVN